MTDLPLVVALVSSVEGRAVIAKALRGFVELMFVSNQDDLFQSAMEDRTRVVILDLRNTNGVFRTEVVQWIRVRRPSVRLLAWCCLDPNSVRDALAAGYEGVSGIIIDGADDAPAIRRAVGIDLSDRDLKLYTKQAVRDVTPEPIRPLLYHCLDRAETPLTVESLASAFGVNRKTIGEWLTRAHGPTPRQIISWSRLLLAGAMLDQSALSVEATALTLGFSSAPALRNLLKRYTGLRASALRRRGALGVIVTRFAHMFGNATVPPADTVAPHEMVHGTAGDIPRRVITQVLDSSRVRSNGSVDRELGPVVKPSGNVA
jgi:AraC-like DNA-binding protein